MKVENFRILNMLNISLKFDYLTFLCRCTQVFHDGYHMYHNTLTLQYCHIDDLTGQSLGLDKPSCHNIGVGFNVASDKFHNIVKNNSYNEIYHEMYHEMYCEI